MKPILIISVTFLFLFSCENKENSNPGTVEFILNEQASQLKSLSSMDTTEIAYALVTIKDKNDAAIYNNEEIVIYKMGDSYITRPLELKPGNYTLTSFMISDKSKVITYATPNKNSKLSYLVKQGLPISFSVGGDQVLKLSPEIVSSKNINPAEFGYSTFSFSKVKTFNVYISAFIYNDTIKNYELTDAQLVLSYQNDTSKANFVLGRKTNMIIIPEKTSNYTLTASKSGYNIITSTFSLDSIRTFQSKPLMLVFTKPGNFLIAHYPFNGNVSDYSGNNNNGTLYGALSTYDRLDSSSSAYMFDGINDYVKVPNSPSLNPTNAITVAAWYKTSPFVGSGNDGLVDKGFTSHISPYYQYHLGVAGNGYWNGNSGFGFSLSLNDNYISVGTGSNFYQLNKWYHVAGTYDGTTMKIYVNGVLIDSKPATGTMKDYGSDLYIARIGNKSDYYNTYFYVPGAIDDVRIYNKALTLIEIQNISQ